MKARATKRFYGLAEKRLFVAGDEFTCSKARFDYLAGEGAVEAVASAAASPRKNRKAKAAASE